MKFGTRQFSAMIPRAEPHLLTDDQAQYARNSKIWRGSLMPVRALSVITALNKPGSIVSIYRFGQNLDSDTQYWFQWLNDTNATPGPIPDDPNERTYFTEAGQPPKVTDSSLALSGSSGQYPVNSYLLGIPTPLLAATTTVGGTPDDGAIAQTTSVVYTYVSGWGEEGPPSAASALFELANGNTLTVDNMSLVPGGAYNIVSKRIYVGDTDATGAATYKFWAEIDVATASYNAAFEFANLAESISDPYLSPPPSDLFNIMVHPNGFMIGFSGKKVCRSEVNMPHGWPIAYQDPVSHDIVGGAIIGNVLIICTTRYTFIGIGTDPLNFQITKLELSQPCVAKRSIVEGDGNVLYASPDGLISVSATGAAVNVTDALFTRDQWQALNPSSFSAYYFKGSYLCFYNNGTAGAFVIDAVQNAVYYLDVLATAGFSDPRRNALFLATAVGNNSHVVRFDPPTNPACTDMLWRSKEYISDRTTSYGAARVIATQYPLTFRFYADNSLVWTQTVTGPKVFTMPQGYRARAFYYELETSTDTRITEALIGSTGASFAVPPYGSNIQTL